QIDLATGLIFRVVRRPACEFVLEQLAAIADQGAPPLLSCPGGRLTRALLLFLLLLGVVIRSENGLDMVSDRGGRTRGAASHREPFEGDVPLQVRLPFAPRLRLELPVIRLLPDEVHRPPEPRGDLTDRQQLFHGPSIRVW